MTSPEPNHNHQLRHQHRPGSHHSQQQQQQQPAYSPHETALQQQQQQQQQPALPHDPYAERPLHYSSDQHLPTPSPHHRPPPPPFPPQHTEMEQPLDLSLSRSPRPGSTGSMLDGLKRSRAEEPAGGGRGGQPGVCLVKGCGCQNSLPIHNHYARLHRHSPYPQFSPSSSGGHRSPGVGDIAGHPHPAAPYSLPPQPAPFPPAPSSSSPSPAMLHEGNSSSASSSSASSAASYYSAPPQGRWSPYGRPGVAGSSPASSSLPPYGSDVMRQSPGSLLCPQQSSASPLSISPRPSQDSNSSPRPPASQTLPRGRDASPGRPSFYRPFEDIASSSVIDISTSSSSSSSSSLTISSSNKNNVAGAEHYRNTSEDDLTASSSLLLLSSTSSSAPPSIPPPQPFSEHAWRDYRPDDHPQRQPLSVRVDEDRGDTEPSQSDAGQTSASNPSHSQLSPVPPHRTDRPSSYYSQAMSVVNGDRYMDMDAASLGQHSHHQRSSEESGGHSVGSPLDHRVAYPHHTSHSDLTGSSSSSASASSSSTAAASTTSCSSPTTISSSTPNPSYPSVTSVPQKPPKTKKFMTVVGTTALSIARVEREKKQAKYSKERMKELISLRKDQQQQQQHQQQQQQQQQQQRSSTVDGNDSEGGSDHSSEQASPRSSDGSEPDVGPGYPIREAPNMKITPFDYMMMEYLVQTRDVPFKPCNREIREIYTGVKKGPLTLVDLIELQVEASLLA